MPRWPDFRDEHAKLGETGSDTALLNIYDISKGHSRVVFKYKTKYLKE